MLSLTKPSSKSLHPSIPTISTSSTRYLTLVPTRIPRPSSPFTNPHPHSQYPLFNKSFTHYKHHQIRALTNATKLDHTPSLLSVPHGAPKPGGWKPTLIHSSGEVKWTVIRVEPGGEVPRHFHHKVWDYFIPLVGRGVIEVTTITTTTTTTTTKTGREMKTKTTTEEGGGGDEVGEQGVEKTYPLNPQSFLAIPPGDIHRVCNISDDEEFVFLIAQSPRHQYDFVDAKE